MLAGYADRSTVNEGGADVYTVAGIIARSESWVHDFSPRWEAVLKREGIDCFHMTDCETRHGEPYKSWSKEKHAAFIAELIGIICDMQCVAGAGKFPCLAAGRRAVVIHWYGRSTRDESAQLTVDGHYPLNA